MVFEYRAEISHVVDGATLSASLDLGFGIQQNAVISLAGISPNSDLDSLAYIYGWLSKNSWLAKFRVHKKGSKYLAYVFPLDAEDESVTLNSDLIESGHATFY